MGHDARTIARYILERARERGIRLTAIHVLKLVYIAHGWFLAMYDRNLIRDPIAAWYYGPVIPNLYHAVKKYGAGEISGDIDGPDETLDAAERELIDIVLDRYGYLEAFQLSALTHDSGTPWDTIWNRHNRVSGYPIPNEVIQTHYSALADRAQQRHG